MGDGPFEVSRKSARAKLLGPQVFSGIREIWVRDVYLKNDYLKIAPGATVVDLGANLGNFTNLALAQHADVRAIAVEPSLPLSIFIRESLEVNGWTNRAFVKRAFLGTETEVQAAVAAGDPAYSGAEYISEAAFLAEFNIDRIDFLKCDIEGSEFFLLDPQSKILSMTRNLAIEIHSAGGSIARFLDCVKSAGFQVGSVIEDGGGACIALCKRPVSHKVVRADGPHWTAGIAEPAAIERGTQ
jgi:FkbM family methyltransferase